MITYDEFCKICEKYGLDVEFNRTCCRTVSHGASFIVAVYQDEKASGSYEVQILRIGNLDGGLLG